MADSKHLDRIEAKIDKLDQRLDKVDIRLAKYNSELEFHVARTTQIEDDLMPIVSHVQQVKGAMWVVGALVALVGLWLTYMSVWGS